MSRHGRGIVLRPYHRRNYLRTQTLKCADSITLSDQARVTTAIPHLKNLDFPDVFVEIAFTNNPGDAPNIWTDISAYVREINVSRGRQFELDRIEAGTCTLRIDNSDGRFDPAWSGSPYYPNVKPMKQIRIRALWYGNTYYIFTGYIESLPTTWQNNVDNEVTLTAVDAFLFLERAALQPGVRLAENTTNRIAWALDQAGFPSSKRFLDAGRSDVGDFDLGPDLASPTPSALDAIQDAVGAERGLFFINGNGDAVFQHRLARYLPPYIFVQTNLSNLATRDSGELDPLRPFTNFITEYDTTHLWNDVRITRPNGVTQVAQDATSITNYGISTYTASPNLTNDPEALAYAGFVLTRYKDPKLRPVSVSVSGRMDPRLWRHILGREISDRIQINVHKPWADTITDVHIEKITHQISNISNAWHWNTSYGLSLAE